MISKHHAYIAVRKDGYVDGACFTQSEDSQEWCKKMKAQGMIVKLCNPEEAKIMLFTYME